MYVLRARTYSARGGAVARASARGGAPARARES